MVNFNENKRIALFVVDLVSNMYQLDDGVLVEFHPAYDLTIRYTKAKDELDKLLSEKAYKLGQATKIEKLLKDLENAKQVISTWDDELWLVMIESAIVHIDKSITFKFQNGKEIRVQ